MTKLRQIGSGSASRSKSHTMKTNKKWVFITICIFALVAGSFLLLPNNKPNSKPVIKKQTMIQPNDFALTLAHAPKDETNLPTDIFLKVKNVSSGERLYGRRGYGYCLELIVKRTDGTLVEPNEEGKLLHVSDHYPLPAPAVVLQPEESDEHKVRLAKYFALEAAVTYSVQANWLVVVYDSFDALDHFAEDTGVPVRLNSNSIEVSP